MGGKICICLFASSFSVPEEVGLLIKVALLFVKNGNRKAGFVALVVV